MEGENAGGKRDNVTCEIADVNTATEVEAIHALGSRLLAQYTMESFGQEQHLGEL